MLEAERADAAKRNAGALTLTVWRDGTYNVWGFRDAEIATACEPETVLLNLDVETLEPLTAINSHPAHSRAALEAKDHSNAG